MTDDMYANDTCFQNMGKKGEKTHTFSDPDNIPTELWIGFQNPECSMSFSTFRQQYDHQHRYVLPNQWRAISSVPRDSGGINPAPEYFMLDTPTGISIGFWSKPERAWLSWESYRRLYPTHWMPLPCRSDSYESEPQEALPPTGDPLIDAAENALYHMGLAIQGRAIGEDNYGALDKAYGHLRAALTAARGGRE